ncbi:MAG: hypothetical protein ACI9GZ_001309 [Bacteroidia bacterium]|jgi:hypothetical protein
MAIKVNEFVIQAQAIQRDKKSESDEDPSKKKLEKITSGEKNKDDVLIAKCLEVVKEYLDREYNRS